MRKRVFIILNMFNDTDHFGPTGVQAADLFEASGRPRVRLSGHYHQALQERLESTLSSRLHLTPKRHLSFSVIFPTTSTHSLHCLLSSWSGLQSPRRYFDYFSASMQSRSQMEISVQLFQAILQCQNFLLSYKSPDSGRKVP